MIKQGVILVLLFSCLAWGGKKQTLPPLFQKKPLDKIYRSCPRPDAGKFVLKIPGNKGSDDLLSESFQLIANPFDRFVLGSSTLAYLPEDRAGTNIAAAIVCRLEDTRTIKEDIYPGKISVWYGRAPVYFSPEKHLWLGPVCRTEWVCRQSQMIENVHLVRQLAVDRSGGCFISFRLSASAKAARSQLKELRFKFEPFSASSTDRYTWNRRPDGTSAWRSSIKHNDSFWHIWCRLPDGMVKRFSPPGPAFECPVGAEDLLIGIKWIEGISSSRTDVSPAELDFERQLSKSHPITGLAAAGRKWIVKNCPAWDSPEPWLNKLWAAHVYSLYSRFMADESAGPVHLSPDSWSIRDARWLRDPRIGVGTILASLDEPSAERLAVSAELAPNGLMFLHAYPDPELKQLLYRHALFMTTYLPKAATANQMGLSGHILSNYLVLAEWSDTENKQKFYREKGLEIFGSRGGSRIGKKGIPANLDEMIRKRFSIDDYDGMVKWCRSFYVNSDFTRAVNVSVGNGGRELLNRMPGDVLDMVVTGVVGLQADGSDRLAIKPVSWIGHWPYFAIDNLPYRGHNLTVAWQSPDGVRRYPDMEPGLNVFVDGKLVKHAKRLESVEVELK